MQGTSEVQWLAKCGSSAVVLLLACGAASAWFGRGPQLSSTTTRDGTFITYNRYIQEPTPDVVLVGSSITFRLKEEYFATPRLRNLALAGGTSVTGLEIVVGQPRLPKVILVEANVLSRATDAALVAKYTSIGRTEALFLRPIRTALAAYENWLHAPLSHEQVSARLDQLLGQPPSDFDNHVYLNRAVEELDAEDPTVAARANASRIAASIPIAEQRGARLLLFELPHSALIEDTRSVRVTSKIVHAQFPEPDRWLHLDFAREELRWADGVHLDERSAVIAARAIEKALASLPGPK
jgi:hypothetical protein